MRPRRRLTAALSLVLGAAVLSTPAPALAEPPSVISGDITDQAGVLTSEETDELRQALAALPVEHDIRLAIVIVDDFDGLSGEDWVQQTFTLSYRRGGGGRALLALAVDEHDYGYLERTILSTSRAEQLATQEVAPLVEQGLWVDAAMAAAQGHTISRSIGGPPIAPRLWAMVLASFLLVTVILVGLTLDRRRGAARALQGVRDETEERLAGATADLEEFRAQEAAIDPLLSDRERHTHRVALSSLEDDLSHAREMLAEVPTWIGWRGNRLPVIRDWAETVDRAGDRISQAGDQFGLARDSLAEVQSLTASLARVDAAEQDEAHLRRWYAAIRDHTRAVPQAQAGVEPTLRAAEADLTSATIGLGRVRTLMAEHRLRPAHTLLEETLAHLAGAAGALQRAEDVRTWADDQGGTTDADTGIATTRP